MPSPSMSGSGEGGIGCLQDEEGAVAMGTRLAEAPLRIEARIDPVRALSARGSVGSAMAETEPSRALFDRQVLAAARVTALANGAHALAVILVGTMILPANGGRVAWTTAGVVLCLVTVVRWIVPERRDRRRIFHEMLVASALFGVLWAVAAGWTFGAGSLEPQVLLASVIAGVIGTGAITLSTHRVLGLVWTASISSGPMVVYFVQGNPLLLRLAALLAVYDLALVLGVLYLSGSFRARCLAEQAAEAGQADLQVLLDDFEAGARDWLWQTGDDDRLTRVSERFCEIAGRPPQVIAALTLAELLLVLGADEDAVGRVARERIRSNVERGEAFSEIVVPIMVGQQRRWWSLSGKRRDGGWRGLGSDLTEAVLSQQRIDRLATTDTITGLPNRQAFEVELAARLLRAGGTRAVHLGIVDIDHFKLVNDTLGHPAGDLLITRVAAALAAELDEREFCARFGGDEFVVLLDVGTDHEGAASRFARLHRAIRAGSHSIAGQVLTVTSSIGVADSLRADDDPSTLISSADLALYAAKGAGRDQVRFWTPELTENAGRRAALVQDLESAVTDGQFETYWQPQIGLEDGRVVGLEALIRWNHPHLGVLTPHRFLQVATESGAIVEMGRSVLDAAVDAARLWAGRRLSLNVSARELLSPGFVAHVVDRVAAAGLPADRFVLEVTEDVIVDEEALTALQALQRAGFGIAMDDFGTGYSSFALLATMRFDEIKIDRSFVRPLTEAEPTFRTLVQTIIDMGAALGARVVAEGVETAAQRDLLRTMGCHSIQGFLEARPQDRETTSAYLRRHP